MHSQVWVPAPGSWGLIQQGFSQVLCLWGGAGLSRDIVTQCSARSQGLMPHLDTLVGYFSRGRPVCGIPEVTDLESEWRREISLVICMATPKYCNPPPFPRYSTGPSTCREAFD